MSMQMGRCRGIMVFDDYKWAVPDRTSWQPSEARDRRFLGRARRRSLTAFRITITKSSSKKCSPRRGRGETRRAVDLETRIPVDASRRRLGPCQQRRVAVAALKEETRAETNCLECQQQCIGRLRCRPADGKRRAGAPLLVGRRRHRRLIRNKRPTMTSSGGPSANEVWLLWHQAANISMGRCDIQDPDEKDAVRISLHLSELLFVLDLERYDPRQQCCWIKLTDHCLHIGEAAHYRVQRRMSAAIPRWLACQS